MPLQRGRSLSELMPSRSWVRRPAGLIEVHPEDVPPLCGSVFTDGSSYPHVISELAYAGWAVVELDADAIPICVIKGPVERTLPQTAPAAEWAADFHACEFIGHGATLFQDCSSLIAMRVKALPLQLAASHLFAGVVKQAITLPGWNLHQDRIKVAAHLNWTVFPAGSLERWCAKGKGQ